MEKQNIKELFKLINKHQYAKINTYEYRDFFPATFKNAIPELQALKIKHPSWSGPIDDVIKNCEDIESELSEIKEPEFVPGKPTLPPCTIHINELGGRNLEILEDLIWEGQPCTDPELRQGNFYETYKDIVAEKAKTQPKKAQAFDNVFNPLKNFLGENNLGLFSSLDTLFSSNDNKEDSDENDYASSSSDEVETESQNGGIKFCPYCGNKLTVASAKFCPNCGKSLN